MKTEKYLPGLAMLVAISALATLAAMLLPEYIGSVFIAVLLGILINNIFNIDKDKFGPGIELGLKKILKLAIILLGAGISFQEMLAIGGRGLLVVVLIISGAFGLTFLLGSLLGINFKQKLLIAAGLSICGNTAVVTSAPIIEAEEEDIFLAVGIVTIFGVIAVFLYPLIGGLLALSDNVFGAWAGTAINDTSQVVAAGFIYSDAAGRVATLIKLTRNVLMVPIILLVGLLYNNNNSSETDSTEPKENSRPDLVKIFPTFILGFLFLAAVNSLGLIPSVLAENLDSLAGFLILLALSGIGLQVEIRNIRRIGFAPLITGLSVAIFMAAASLLINFLIF